MNEFNVCGRCGTQFQGIECPGCGLIMCNNIIDNLEMKKRLLDTAISFLKNNNLITNDDQIENAIANFYYIISSKSDGSISAAFRINTATREIFFNYVNSSLQFLKPEGKEMYEKAFNDVIKFQRINDRDTNRAAYQVPISILMNPTVECKNCHNMINPYDIVCKKCGVHIGNDYPDYFKDMTFKVTLDNVPYLITFVVPNNLKVVGGSNEYFTLADDSGPSFISFKFLNQSNFYNSASSRIGETKEYVFLDREVKTGFTGFSNGDIIFNAEVKFYDNLYGIIEYQINGAKSIDNYDEFNVNKYMAILHTVTIKKEH